MSSLSSGATASSSQSNRTAYLSLAVGVFAIGWSAILVRWSGVSGLVSAFYRLAIATLVLIPWRLLAKAPATTATRKARIAAITAGVLFAADLAFFNSAVMATSAANASLLGVNAPIFVAFGAWVMYGERPTARFWLGFALAFAGMLAIVGADVLLHPSLGYGDVLAVAGAFCYGIYILYVGRSRAGMDTLTFSTWSAAVGAFCMLVVCLVARQSLSGFSGRSWAALIALALTSQVVGQLFIAHALGHLPPAPSSIGLLGQAPLTALLAWPMLGEPIRLGQVVGGALVLAGIFVVNALRSARSSPTPSTRYRAASARPR
ncbi:MAG TPA: DMT family transporter [Gemmatimonadaceae bacterium]|nr:DMT family transporter [Gemmatimonadaceae bacterium]